MKNARRHEEAMAKNPRTTITAIAQCGNSSALLDWRFPGPPVDDAPEALVDDDKPDDAEDEREADAELDAAAAADEEDMLAMMESGKVVWTAAKCVWVWAEASKVVVLGVMAK